MWSFKGGELSVSRLVGGFGSVWPGIIACLGMRGWSWLWLELWLELWLDGWSYGWSWTVGAG